METFEQHYQSMSQALLKHLPNADMDLIDRAVEYAAAKHEYQKRKDGSPYIIHPLAVAQIVAENQDVDLAILKSRSPTCGVKQVYDGTFSGVLVDGSGTLAQALKEAGIKVLDAEDIE